MEAKEQKIVKELLVAKDKALQEKRTDDAKKIRRTLRSKFSYFISRQPGYARTTKVVEKRAKKAKAKKAEVVA